MFSNGLQYAILQSCIVRYSVNLKLTVHIDGNHDRYSFDVFPVTNLYEFKAVEPNSAIFFV